jgi:hypothetical protein
MTNYDHAAIASHVPTRLGSGQSPTVATPASARSFVEPPGLGTYIYGTGTAACEMINLKDDYKKMSNTVKELQAANQDTREGLARLYQRTEHANKALDEISQAIQRNLATVNTALNSLKVPASTSNVHTLEQIRSTAMKGIWIPQKTFE